MRHDFGHMLRAVAVRADLAADDLRLRIVSGAARRTHALRDDGELGAQAAEYAMLGGVSAAACGTLVIVLKEERRLGGLVDTILGWLGGVVGSWL